MSTHRPPHWQRRRRREEKVLPRSATDWPTTGTPFRRRLRRAIEGVASPASRRPLARARVLRSEAAMGRLDWEDAEKRDKVRDRGGERVNEPRAEPFVSRAERD